MTVTTDADARFDRTIERWFRDMLAMRSTPPFWASTITTPS